MKKILLLASCILGGFTLAAQETSGNTKQANKHEFLVNAGGGLSSLVYTPLQGERCAGFGGVFGLGYIFNFNNAWGISTGLELGIYNSSYKAGAVKEVYTIPHPPITPAPDGDYPFYVHNDYRDYKESQTAVYLNIPIMAQYALPVGPGKFYLAAGVKLGLPLSAMYKAEAASLATWGYSTYTGQEYRQENGFRAQENVSYDGDMDLKLSASLAIETGMRWNLSERWGLYTGLFFDYGLTDINNATDKQMTAFPDYNHHSLLNTPESGASRINLMMVGLKVKLAFN